MKKLTDEQIISHAREGYVLTDDEVMRLGEMVAERDNDLDNERWNTHNLRAERDTLAEMLAAERAKQPLTATHVDAIENGADLA